MCPFWAKALPDHTALLPFRVDRKIIPPPLRSVSSPKTKLHIHNIFLFEMTQPCFGIRDESRYNVLNSIAHFPERAVKGTVTRHCHQALLA